MVFLASDRVLRPMIITKQLDIKGADKAATPRTNLVKELEKYSRHSETVEKRTASSVLAPGTSQGKSDTVATSLVNGPLLLQKMKVDKPVAKERPNILSKRPRFRPQQRSSSTDSSSSTSSSSSQALNLSTRIEPNPLVPEMRVLEPTETPISAAAALTIPNPSVISTSIPTPPTISVTQKGVSKLMVPVTTNSVFPASPDDIVIPAGKGYVVYKPVKTAVSVLKPMSELLSNSGNTSEPVSSPGTPTVSPVAAANLENVAVAVSAVPDHTVSPPLSSISMSGFLYRSDILANTMLPPSSLPLVTKTLPTQLVQMPSTPLSSKNTSITVAVTPTQSQLILSSPVSIPVGSNQNQIQPVLKQKVDSVPVAEIVQNNSKGQIRASLRQKLDQNEFKRNNEVLSNLLKKPFTELKQNETELLATFTSTGAAVSSNLVTVTNSVCNVIPVSNVAAESSQFLLPKNIPANLNADYATYCEVPDSNQTYVISNKSRTFCKVLSISNTDMTTAPCATVSVDCVANSKTGTKSASSTSMREINGNDGMTGDDSQRAIYFRKMILPSSSDKQTRIIPKTIIIPKHPTLSGINDKMAIIK